MATAGTRYTIDGLGTIGIDMALYWLREIARVPFYDLDMTKTTHGYAVHFTVTQTRRQVLTLREPLCNEFDDMTIKIKDAQ